jgi:hypothetical protein
VGELPKADGADVQRCRQAARARRLGDDGHDAPPGKAARHRAQRVTVGQANRSAMLGTRHKVRPETWAWAMPSRPAVQRMRVMMFGS